MKVLHVVGARPNFMKTAPIMTAMARRPDRFEQLLVHTGQHYDDEMSAVFFRDLDLPQPDRYLEVGSGSHAQQTARVMTAFEPVVEAWQPDWVLVVGDVNSTLACTLVCAKLGVRVAHVEAGLRSGDRSMPEEINRLVTDQLADLLFTPSRDADENLLGEGIAPEKIRFVGNVMIDTLAANLAKAQTRPIVRQLGLAAGAYALVTLHRPANVDDRGDLEEILQALRSLADQVPVVFPLHPRTRQSMGPATAADLAAKVTLLEPLGYLDFVALLASAGVVITDSGGVQEESTYLGVPCLTVRPNTERPVTLTRGTNQLVPRSRTAIVAAALDALAATPHTAAGAPGVTRAAGKPVAAAPSDPTAARTLPDLWDGHAAERIVQVLLDEA